MTNEQLKKELVAKAKEEIKNDWNYKKGISKTSEAIDKLIEKVGGYDEIKSYIEEWNNGDIEEFIDDELRVECAKTTNSIYIKLFDEQVRISDHSSSELNRNFAEMVTGSAETALYID